MTNAEIEEIISWVDSPEKVLYWAGPRISFPLSSHSFKKEILGDDRYSHIEYSHGQVVGFGQVLKIHTSQPHLGRIIISPSCRGKGYGNRLMEALIIYCMTHMTEVEAIYLNVFADNVPAISLYKKYGFKEIAREKNARELNGNKFDIIRMKRTLSQI